MSNVRQWKSWSLGLVVCGLGWAVGCEGGNNPPDPEGETGGMGGTGLKGPSNQFRSPKAPVPSGPTLTLLSGEAGTRDPFGRPPKPPKRACCRPGAECEEEMP